MQCARQPDDLRAHTRCRCGRAGCGFALPHAGAARPPGAGALHARGRRPARGRGGGARGVLARGAGLLWQSVRLLLCALGPGGLPARQLSDDVAAGVSRKQRLGRVACVRALRKALAWFA